MKASGITEGGVYQRGADWRRVVAIREADGKRYCVYSLGTDRNRVCLVSTLARWARRRIEVTEDRRVVETA